MCMALFGVVCVTMMVFCTSIYVYGTEHLINIKVCLSLRKTNGEL